MRQPGVHGWRRLRHEHGRHPRAWVRHAPWRQPCRLSTRQRRPALRRVSVLHSCCCVGVLLPLLQMWTRLDAAFLSQHVQARDTVAWLAACMQALVLLQGPAAGMLLRALPDSCDTRDASVPVCMCPSPPRRVVSYCCCCRPEPGPAAAAVRLTLRARASP